ncbi:MAG TPA: MFS transporter [Thermoanaerobaculia bacterium]|nr:MFS transporter [Thermoanaerobaculia bacterium]
MTTAAVRRGTLAATIIGSGMTFLDATVVNVALPALQVNLHATVTDVQWVIEAYALFLGALLLVGGSLGDQLGRRRVFLAGVLVFTGASVVCGLAPSARLLIAGRALQGIGAALLVPGSLAILSATFGEGERGRAIGTWSGFSAITAAVGPVSGGWLIEHLSWRAVFFLNVPLAAAVLVLSLRYVPESRDPSRAAGIDSAGAALAVLGLGGVVFGLLQWPLVQPAPPLVVAALVVGPAALVLLPLVERRARSPMLPLHLFRSRPFALANALTLLLYAALGVVTFLVPLDLIEVQGYTATQAGAALLPFALVMLGLSRWSGALVARVGSRLPLTVGPLIAALGLALYARTGIGGSYWTTFFPAIAVLGFGMAITVAPLTTTVMGAVAAEHAGVASGINNTVSRVAGLLAIALFGVVLVHTFDQHVHPRFDRLALPPAARAAVARELPKMAGAQLQALPAVSPPQRVAIRRAIDEAFVAAFRRAMAGAAALALAAAAVGAGIPARPSAPAGPVVTSCSASS